MRFFIWLSALTVLALPALAQQRQPTPAEQLQALNGKLQDEINQDMQVRQILSQAQSMIAEQQKEIEELKAKYEPTPLTSDKPPQK